MFIDNLPGPPDGITRASDGAYWVTITAGFPPPAKYSHLRLVRALIGFVPSIMRAAGVHLPGVGLILKVSAEGEVVQALGDPGGKVLSFVSAATEHDGMLFIGTLGNKGVPVLNLKGL